MRASVIAVAGCLSAPAMVAHATGAGGSGAVEDGGAGVGSGTVGDGGSGITYTNGNDGVTSSNAAVAGGTAGGAYSNATTASNENGTNGANAQTLSSGDLTVTTAVVGGGGGAGGHTTSSNVSSGNANGGAGGLALSVTSAGSTVTNQGSIVGGGGGGGGQSTSLSSTTTDTSGSANGGAGGDAIDVTAAQVTIRNQSGATIAGGAGGGGGWSTSTQGTSSVVVGGNGGVGVSTTASTVSITNNGTITGGNGGSAGGSNGHTQSASSGGAGGIGVVLGGSNDTLTNTGTITGGAGGQSSSYGTPRTSGAGGVAVVMSGTNGSLVNSGLIAGGMNGSNTAYADAVDVTGSNNTVEVDAGATFVGNVVSTSGNGNTLALGGTTNASFNLNQIVASTPSSYNGTTYYYGFDKYQKVGSGTWTLTGTATSTAPWSIDAGTLNVAGNLAAATVTVNSGGTLTGSGTVGATSVANGGTLAAASGSSLAINGDLSFAAGSIYNVTVTATGLTGLTAVTGNVTIQPGSVLQLSAVSGTYSTTTRYTILTYTGTQTGQFSSVTSNLAYLTPTVSYANGTIALTMTSTLGSPGTSGSSSMTSSSGFALPNSAANSNNAAGALTRLYSNGGNALTTALIGATTSDARNTLTQVAGDETGAFGQIASQSLVQSSAAVSQRLAQVGGGMTGVSSGDAPLNKNVWAQVNYTHTRTAGDNTTGASAYQQRSTALTLGYDQEITPEWRVGGGIAGNDDTVSFENRSASGRIDGAQALLYAAYTPTTLPLFVKGGLSAGWWENTVNRSLSVGTLSGNTRGTFDTTGESAYLETGTTLHLGAQYLQPYLGANVARYQQQSYSESTTSGSNAFALSYGSNQSTSIATTLGIRLGQQGAALLGHALDWQLDAGWQHRYGARNSTVQASFANANTGTFSVNGTNLDKDMAVLSAGASFAINDHAQVYAKLNAALGASTHAYGGMGGVRWRW